MYGKLFERLVLGGVLSALGFTRVDRGDTSSSVGVFWLSDPSDTRECDATLIVKPGVIVRFDIGFIGPGNPEISKDKLSRYAREAELGSGSAKSTTFVIIDRLPRTGKTEAAAKRIGAQILQMSLQYWPKLLAMELQKRTGVPQPLAKLKDSHIEPYLRERLAKIDMGDFLSGVSVEELEDIEAS